MEVKSRRLNEKGTVRCVRYRERKRAGEAAQDWVPVALATGMAFYFLRLCRLIFIEALWSVSGTVARCWRWIGQRRTGSSARPSAPWRGSRRAGGWGKSPGGRVEGRGTTSEVVAGDAQRLSATDGQTAKEDKHRRSNVQMKRRPGAGVLKMLRSPDLSGRSLTERQRGCRT